MFSLDECWTYIPNIFSYCIFFFCDVESGIDTLSPLVLQELIPLLHYLPAQKSFGSFLAFSDGR
jgi:hypothetical protein